MLVCFLPKMENAILETCLKNIKTSITILDTKKSSSMGNTQVFDTLPESTVVSKVVNFQTSIMDQLEKDSQKLNSIISKYKTTNQT